MSTDKIRALRLYCNKQTRSNQRKKYGIILLFRKTLDAIYALVCKIIILVIQSYRVILKPFLGNNCRFYPSCSDYAYIALKNHGTYGIALSVLRIMRCHPFHLGGIDLVPVRPSPKDH